MDYEQFLEYVAKDLQDRIPDLCLLTASVGLDHQAVKSQKRRPAVLAGVKGL